MDYTKAFSATFDDKDWPKKVLIGGLLYLGFFLIIPIFIVQGYMVEHTQRVIRGDFVLPQWDNLGGKLQKGFSVSVILFVYSLPAILFLLILFMAIFFIAILTGGQGQASDAVGLLIGLLMLAGYALYFIYLIAFMLITPVLIVQYAQTQKIGSAFQFSNIFKIVKANFVQVLILLGFTYISSFIGGIGMIACFIGFFFTIFYAQLVMHNLYGQFARMLEEKSGH